RFMELLALVLLKMSIWHLLQPAVPLMGGGIQHLVSANLRFSVSQMKWKDALTNLRILNHKTLENLEQRLSKMKFFCRLTKSDFLQVQQETLKVKVQGSTCQNILPIFAVNL